MHRFHIASKYADKDYVACWYGNPWQHQKKTKTMNERTLATKCGKWVTSLSEALGENQTYPKNKKLRTEPNLEILGSSSY